MLDEVKKRMLLLTLKTNPTQEMITAGRSEKLNSITYTENKSYKKV